MKGSFFTNVAFCLGVAGFSLLTCSQRPEPQESMTSKALLDELNKIQAEADMKNASLGFCMYDLSLASPVAEYQSTRSLTPASTMKVVTTATALCLLGEQYKFETQLQYEGQIQNGQIKGSLIIKGGGDPTLGKDGLNQLFEEWCKALKNKGITEISGDIIGDERIFEYSLIPESWIWGDMGNYYGAGACGLSINENQYEIFFKPGSSVGAEAKYLRCEPEMKDITFVNEMKTGASGSGDNGYVFGSEYSYLRYLRGTIPMGVSEFSIKGSIPDPALYCAKKFKEYLQSNGIKVLGEASTCRLQEIAKKEIPEKRSTLHSTYSADLKTLISKTNHKSINLYAETLLKLIGYKQSGQGSTQAGTKAVEAFWKSKGLDLEGFDMADGSGLSRINTLTAKNLSMLLKLMQKESCAASFWESLPIAGKTGTLASVANGTSAEGRVYAKSGSFRKVRSYAGYVKGISGKNYSFAIIVNNYSGSNSAMTSRFERIMVLMSKM